MKKNIKKIQTVACRVPEHVKKEIAEHAKKSHRNPSDELRMLLDKGMQTIYGKGFEQC